MCVFVVALGVVPNKGRRRILYMYFGVVAMVVLLDHLIKTELTEWSAMRSARFLSHMNHVSVSPTDGNGPTQGQRKALTRVGIEHTTFGLDLRRSTEGKI